MVKSAKKILRIITDGKRVRIGSLILCDSVCVGTVFWLTLWGYRLLGFGQYDMERYWRFLPFLSIFLICNALFGNYHGSPLYPGICSNKIEEVRRIFLAVFLAYLMVFAWLMFSRMGELYSRFGLVVAMILTIPALQAARFFTRYLMKHLKFGQIDILIAGVGRTGEVIRRELTDSCHYGFRVVGCLDDDPKKQGKMIGESPVLGTLSAARELSRQLHVEYVICCLPVHLLDRVFRDYSKFFRHITFIVDNRVLPISWLRPASIGLYGGFEIQNQLLLRMPRLLKNVLEIVLAFSVILCLLPLFLILAIVVKVSSPGPIFYFADRLGMNGKKIKVLKFRTMYADAESRLEKMLEENPELKREWAKKFKLRNDPRITSIGKFLRNTSLDELPQFWNVLAGEMAVIGPRPIVEDEVKFYGESYELRQRVRPGITGLWQVSGRSETDYDNRVMLDMYYIMNWSIWMDYYIFFKTIYIVIARRGAY